MTLNPAKRPKRVPLGTRNILTAPKREGFVRRFVNDVDDRVKRFKEAGYTVVQDASLPIGDPGAGKDSNIGSPVVKAVGGNRKAVLMEIPEGFYHEDQAAKQRGIAESEEAMKQNILRNKELNHGGQLDIARR